MATALDQIIVQLWRFIEPLQRAVASEEQLERFLARLGYRLDAASLGGAFGELGPLQTNIGDLSGVLSQLASPADITTGIAGQATAKAAAIFDNLRQLGSAGPSFASLQIDTSIFVDCFDLLLHDYLRSTAPAAAELLIAVEALVYEPVPANSGPGRTFAYTRIRFDWARLGQLFQDFDGWARDVYGWGTAFNHEKALHRLSRMMDFIGYATRFEALPPSQAALLLKNVPPDTPLHRVAFPLIAESATDAAGNVTAAGEAGLMMAPWGDFAQPQNMGLAAAPYAEGAVTGTFAITPDLKLAVTANLQAAGGLVLTLDPTGLNVRGGAAVDAGFEFNLKYEHADATPIILLGDAAATHVKAQALLLNLGGSLDGDLFVAGGVKKLGAVVDFGEDGLLSMLLSGPIVIDAGDLLIGWRAGRGVYFEGGTSLKVKIPLDLALGPINLYDITVGLDWSHNLQLTTAVTADATLGPLYAYVDGLGLITTLVPKENGVLGKYDLEFGIALPTAYAVSLKADPIQGGGYLAVLDHEYRGALALKFQTFGFSAFAILTTRMPNGDDGFSFVASVFVEFSIQLGYGFVLTGLGGIIGINRTIVSDALRTVLFEGRLDNLLFPADPIKNAATILQDMADIYPPREGQYVFGPMARIGWGTPTLIEGKIGIVLEVGQEFRLLILGAIGAHLPTVDDAVVALNFTFMGEIDFAAGTVSLDASLQGSRILEWPIAGDLAVRTGWGARIEQVASFGGLHPSYPRPANLPDLRRLSINFGTNNPRVTLAAYQALTSNSVQFGARAELYAKGPSIPLIGQLAAEGQAYFDALIYFNPFAFDIALGGGISLLVDGDVVVGLGFDLRLTGPSVFVLDGKVWATVLGINVSFPIHKTWGEPRDLPAAVADPLALLTEALAGSARIEPVAPQVRTEGVVLAKPRDAGQPAPLSPIAGIRIAQNVLPLAATIEKVGEGIVQGAVRRFDIRLSDAHDVLLPNVSAVQQEFVRGHYWTLSESERLRVPALEQHKAGVEFSADEVVFDAARAVDLDVDYEVLVVPGDEPAVATGRSIAIDAAILQRWARVPAQRRVARQQDRGRVEQRTDAVRARPTRYVAPDGGGMSMNVPPESVDLAAASAVVAEYVRRSA